mgnify:CR=1 FL=1
MGAPTLGFKSIIDELGGEAAFAYLARAKELASKGINVINFGIGQPDIPTFDHIIKAAKDALDARFTGYTETVGIRELREAISEYINRRYNSDVKPSEIILTPGAKCALFLAIAAYLREGDEIIVPEPTFPAYPEVAKFFGAKPVYVPLKWLGGDGGFTLDLDAIERAMTSRTKMIVINNPHNPTGKLFTKEEIEELMALAKKRGIIVLADEIYDHFVYDEANFKSLLSLPEWRDYVVYVNGFSKTYSMTGWRLGYLIAREDVTSKLSKLAVNVYSCPNSFVQKAAIEAIKGSGESIKRMINLFRERRDFIYARLREVYGFDVWPSKGAFYIFPNISRVLNEARLSVEEFVSHLLMNYGVVVLPGTAFPENAGKEFIRISFAVDLKDIDEGVKRIKECVSDLINKKRLARPI